MYEPRDLAEFEVVYKMAEEFSQEPLLRMWIGMNDIGSEGAFVYNSYGDDPSFNAPWQSEY